MGGSSFLDLCGKQRAELVPPKADRFVGNIDAAFVKQVLDIPQRKRIPDVHHSVQADDLGRCFEIAKWVCVIHSLKLG